MIVGLMAFLFASCDSKNGSSAEENFHVHYAVEFSEGSTQIAEMIKQQGMDISSMGLDLYVTKDQSGAKMDLGMMAMSVIADSDAKEAVMLLNAQGRKMSVEIGPEEFADFIVHQNKDVQGDATLTDETKEIAGYACKLAKVNTTGGDVGIWFTESLKSASQATGFNYGLNGVPLEIEMKQGPLQMRFIANAVNTGAPDAKHFDMTVPEGYQSRTIEDLGKM